jgi:hypothetical protein
VLHEYGEGSARNNFGRPLVNLCGWLRQGAAHLSKGNDQGWENRTDIWGAGIVGTDGEGVLRKETVFELKGTDRVYLIVYCGAFQAGQFGLGQPVDYRVDDDQRLYIRRDNGKENKCKIEGQKAPEEAKSVAPPAKP